MEYICIRCGKKFEAKRKTSVCQDCHTAVCVVCGKEFQLQTPWTQQTCSSKCRGIYRKQSGIAKSAAAKAHSHPAKMPKPTELKVCPICGQEFLPDTFRQVYCKATHYGPCPICGQEVEIKDLSIGPTTCSEECKKLQTYATNMLKYGSEVVLVSDNVRRKAKETLLKKHGVEHYSQTDEYKEKYRQTMLERHGVEHPLQNPDILAKAQETNTHRYGGVAPTSSPEVRRKVHETNEKRYGGTGFASEELSEKMKETNLQKYGTEYPTQSQEVKDKIAETSMKKYGAKNFKCSEKGYESSISDPSKHKYYLEFKFDPAVFIHTHFDHKPTVAEICRETGVTDTPVYEILIENCCRDLIDFKSSSMEVELYQFLMQYFRPEDIVRNCRSVISPQEIDIYIPSKKFGIECNPTVTHNSSYDDPWGQSRKAPSYHKHKTDSCESEGVFLFHVFGYEWKARPDVVKSMILNALGLTPKRVYARNTCVKLVDASEGDRFLSENHRQGATSASIRLGLYEGDTLVSLMTFNKMRSTIGVNKESSSEDHELSRFCSLLNTSVIGGASKLFNHFIQNYTFSKIVSFSDRAHTRGSLYKILGFEKTNVSDASYVWVRLLDDSYLTRVSCQKKRLVNLFDDVNNSTIENSTEREIMMDHGYAQVFDSGTIRWEFVKHDTEE